MSDVSMGGSPRLRRSGVSADPTAANNAKEPAQKLDVKER